MNTRQPLGPFTKGINLVDPLTMLEPDELSRCPNYRIGPRGDVYKRPGHGTYGSAPAKVNDDNFVNLLLRFYKSDGTRKTIAAAGGKLRFADDVSGAWTDISIDGSGASMSATNLADWMVYKDRLYITDGVRVQRYNLTDNIYAGYFIHAAPTTALGGTTGDLTLLATYKYFVTSVTSDMGEGPKGAEASRALTGTNDQINLSVMAAAPAKHNEVTKRIYRTKANGTLFYYLTEIPTATTTFNDTLADTALGEEYEPVSAPPATARFCVIGHDERAYYCGMSGADASLVRVSAPGFPDQIVNGIDGTDGFLAVANNDGDRITGLGLVPGGVVFLKQNSIWLMRAFGFGLNNIHPKDKRGPGVGTISPFSVVTTPIGMIFLSQRGEIYRFDGNNIDEIGRKVASEFKGMSESAISKVVACYHDYRYQISYDFRGQKGYNWKTIEYDTLADKWEGPHENGTLYTPSYYSVWDSVKDHGELAWGESRAAGGSYVYIRREFTSSDRGTKFLSRLTGGRPIANGLAPIKSTKMFVHAEISSDATLTATHVAEDGSITTVALTTPIAATTGVWDTPDWGPDADEAVWGGINSQVLEGPLHSSASSRLPQYEISDGGTADFSKITRIELLVDPQPLK